MGHAGHEGRVTPGSRARVEDLEEALRRIVVLLEPDGRHHVTARDWAALAFACDLLGIDPPEPDWTVVAAEAG